MVLVYMWVAYLTTNVTEGFVIFHKREAWNTDHVSNLTVNVVARITRVLKSTGRFFGA